MPNTTFAGHPLHPQLIYAPMGLLPFSFAMDVMHALTGEQSYADAAYYSMAAGYVGALAAGAAGAADYFSIPANTESKKTAAVHGALNLGALGLYGLNLVLRGGRRSGTGVLPVLLSAAGVAGLVFSGWLGGKLVYDLGMRVKPVMEGDESPEVKLPGDERLEKGFERLEKQLTPADGSK